MVEECPFCGKVTEEKERIISEGKSCYAVLSNPRKMPGHLLVIPKRHVVKISELDSEEKAEIMDFLAKFQDKILMGVAGGCDVRQHYRPFIKDSRIKVSHLHFHLHPRELEDELYEKSQRFETDMFKDLSEEERERMMRIFGD